MSLIPSDRARYALDIIEVGEAATWQLNEEARQPRQVWAALARLAFGHLVTR